MVAPSLVRTKVMTEDSLVPIEDIEPGDLVWATDEVTGETALKEVVQLFRNETEEWVHITVNGEKITCTPEHPFYVPQKGWTSAVDLRAGDILVILNGEYVVVEQVQHELLESSEITYNFEVEDFHTYHVSESEVLVHNSCKHNSKWNAERKNYWKGEAQAYSGNVNGQISSSGTYKLTKNNYNRMLQGKAPKGTDGYSVQLHHYRGIDNDFYAYGEILRSEHTAFYKALHPWLFKH